MACPEAGFTKAPGILPLERRFGYPHRDESKRPDKCPERYGDTDLDVLN
jgi:hypothetical protein